MAFSHSWKLSSVLPSIDGHPSETYIICVYRYSMCKYLHLILLSVPRLGFMAWKSILQIFAPSECVVCGHLLYDDHGYICEDNTTRDHLSICCLFRRWFSSIFLPIEREVPQNLTQHHLAAEKRRAGEIQGHRYQPLPLCETCLTAMLPKNFLYCRTCGFPLQTQSNRGLDTPRNASEEGLCLACVQHQRFLSKEKSTYPEGLLRLEDDTEPFAREFFFDSVTPLGIYTEALSDTILQTKNRSGNAITATLAELLATLRREEILSFRPDIICSIPAASRTRRERGTNNAEQIARTLSRCLKITYQPLLYKKKRTVPQKSLPTIQRRFQNVQSVYTLSSLYRRPKHLTWRQRFRNAVIRRIKTDRWIPILPKKWQNGIRGIREQSNSIAGKRILLIDDILTTGATCSEAARILKEKGNASEVHVAVLARAGVTLSTLLSASDGKYSISTR